MERIERGFKVPHTYVILFSVMLIVALLTYIVPAGEFDRYYDEVTEQTLVDGESFHQVEQNPTKFFDLAQAVPKGMEESAQIIFFIFIVGGAFQIITASGTIESGIGNLAKKLEGRENLMIPIFVLIFSIGGMTFGMSEEVIVFVPIGIALARALGFDAITGTAMISLGAATGFSAAVMNPFTIGVAQDIAELPLFSGVALRIGVLLVMLIVTSTYIIRYGKKVKEDPSASVVKELESKEKDETIDINNLTTMTRRHKLILVVVALGFIMIGVGVFRLDWYIGEIGSTFLAMGVISGLIGGLNPSRIAEEFVEGAKGMAFGALVVGVARGILVVMTEGMIMDTLVHNLSNLIMILPRSIAVFGMYIVQMVINFFIPSGSGQAAVTMPIMTPLADLLGITRQTAVLSFQFGDAFTNSIIPTSGSLMACLSIGNIPYEKWFKFIWPLMLIWISIGGVFLVIANAISYGPF